MNIDRKEKPEHNPEQNPERQEALQKKRRRLQRLSQVLDDAFTIPIVNIKVGWDAIIGLIPVVGDVVGALLSLYLVQQALTLKVGAFAILRMLFNVVIELLLGIVPVLGDFFDVTWRANRKNYQLIERHLARQLDKTSAGTSTETTNNRNDTNHESARTRKGLRLFYQTFLGLLCLAVLYYLLVQWQAGNIVIPEDFHPFLFFQRL